MANRIQHLRGSNTEHSTYTGAKGEISLVTDTSANRIPTGELRVHDGTTAGGLPVKLGTTDKPLTSNIVMGSGYGIDFASYATSGNPSSNLLDDYEEGTWTPVLSNNGYLFGTHTGSYVKVGKMVYVSAFLNITTVGSNTSNINISGFPFNSHSTTNEFHIGVVRETLTTGILYVAQINVGTSIGGLNSMDGVTTGSNEIFTTGKYALSLTYITS